MKKRLVAFSLVLVLVLSLACTALAATKPTVTLRGKQPTSIKRGKTITFSLNLDSKSYKKKNGAKRAQIRNYLYDSNFRKIQTFQKSTWTGKVNYKFYITPSKSVKTGTYNYTFDLWYRSKAGAKWKSTTPGKVYYCKFKVKK